MPEIQMPKLSDTMTEGTLVTWKKKKGDKVSAGEVLAEIETDKATMEWESAEDGTLTEIYVEEGGKVNVGDKIAFIGGEGEEAPKEEEKEKAPKEKEDKPKAKEEEKAKPEQEKEKEEAKPKAEATKEEPKEKKEKPKAEEKGKKGVAPKAEREETPVEAGVSPAQPVRLPSQPEEARVKASPVARRIAAELGVDLSRVKGTGPNGRITETDVRAAAKSVPATADHGRAKPEPSIKAGESARIQLSGMRKIIAQRLVESLGPVPHFYLEIDIDAGPLMEVREELKSAGEGADAAKITVNDFVLKASVQAAIKVPRVNASFDSDAIVQYADVDLGIAVAIEDGLLTPVIRGGMGIDSFSAVINPPQGFILALGKITKVPVIDNCDRIVVGHRMSITMSCDHRVIDGALGAEYLKELRHLLENPALLMV